MVPDRTDFPAFPYQPYGIQQDFMQALHQTLTSGGVGLFESPTGQPLPTSSRQVAQPNLLNRTQPPDLQALARRSA